MPHNVLLTGSDDLLAAYVGACELAHGSDISIYRVQPADKIRTADFLRCIAAEFKHLAPEKNADSIQHEISSRLHIIDGSSKAAQPDLPQNVQPERVWCFIPTQRNFSAQARDSFMRFLAALPPLGTRELNLVITAYPKGQDSEETRPWISEAAVAEQCKAENITFRIFRTSLIVGESRTRHNDHDLLHFLDALYQLQHEIQDRVPEYFNFEPLRCLAPQNAEINLIHPEHAAELMTTISWRDDTRNRSYDIASPENTSFTDICERIESAYNLSLQVAEDDQELNAVDRLFREQTEVFQKYLELPQQFAWEEAYKAAGFERDKALMDKSTQIKIFKAIHEQQEAARSARDERVTALPRQLAEKNINKNGFTLTYFTGGADDGTPVIILNALGQGLVYWYRLMDVLMQKHRVVIWEPRGTISPPPPFGLKEQVEDLEAIMQQEGIKSCHLVGWCTGPKVAVEFYLRSPAAVQSMVFLNSQFKCAGTPRELVTSYERNLEPMFQKLATNPGLAGAVMSSLQINLSGGKLNLFEQDDSQKLAVEVLSRINQTLKDHVLLPYQSEATTLNYARQVLDYWTYDTLANAPQVQVPVLLVATEYDKIAAPAISKAALKHFPQSSLVEVRGATHYCLFDRPEFIAGLMEDFFESSAAARR